MNVGKKTLLMMFGTGFQQAITFVLIIMLSRVLSKDEYATYSQGNLVYKTLLPILQLGIPLTVSYFLPQAENIGQEKRVLKNLLGILVTGAIIGFTMVTCFGQTIANVYNNKGFSDVVVVVAIYVFFEIINSMIPNYYLSIGNNKKLAKLTIGISTLRALGVIVSFLLSKNVYYIFVALAFASFVKTSIFLIDILSRYFKCQINKEKQLTFIMMLKYSMIIGFSQMFGQISVLLDQNIVASMFSSEEYAIFVNGAVDIPFIALIGSSIASVLLPTFAKGEYDDMEMLKKWKAGIVYTASFLIPIMISLFVIAPTYITIFFSEEYVASVPIFRIYLFKIPTMIATYSTILLAKNANKKVLLNTILSLVANVVLNISFINLIGVKGAAIGSIASLYLLVMLQIVQIKKIMKVSIKEVMPYKDIMKIFIVCLCLGIIMYWCSCIVVFNKIVRDIVLAIIFTLAMWAVILKIGIIKKENLISLIKGRRK